MLFFRQPPYLEPLMAHTSTNDYRSEESGSMQLQQQRENMDTNELGSSGLEKMDGNSTEQRCCVENCQAESIIVLGTNPFCLQHFISHCYDWLDQLDPAVRDRSNDAADVPRIKAMIEECSNRALLVSLRCETLNNLDRSRLLDILLRCSDLLYSLRIPSNMAAWLPVFPQDNQKPQREKKLPLGSQLQTNKLYGV
jgi:hypothetical protein